MSGTTDKFLRLLGKEIKKLEAEVYKLRADRDELLEVLQLVGRELQELLDRTMLSDGVADNVEYLVITAKKTIDTTIADET